MQNIFKNLKIIAGASLILTASIIMLPGISGYALSLSKLVLIILFAVVISSFGAFLGQNLLAKKKNLSNLSEPNSQTKTDSE